MLKQQWLMVSLKMCLPDSLVIITEMEVKNMNPPTGGPSNSDRAYGDPTEQMDYNSENPNHLRYSPIEMVGSHSENQLSVDASLHPQVCTEIDH